MVRRRPLRREGVGGAGLSRQRGRAHGWPLFKQSSMPSAAPLDFALQDCSCAPAACGELSSRLPTKASDAECLRPSARTSALALRASMRSFSMKCCAAWSGSARTETSCDRGLKNIIDREREQARSALKRTEFSAFFSGSDSLRPEAGSPRGTPSRGQKGAWRSVNAQHPQRRSCSKRWLPQRPSGACRHGFWRSPPLADNNAPALRLL